MADPLSISSGVAGLLALVISVAQTSYQYAASVKDASKSIKAYLRELLALQTVLYKLNELLLEAVSSGVFAGSQSPLLSILDIEECQDDLEYISKKLQKRSKPRMASALTWPFVEKDTEKYVDMLHRHQKTFHVALSADAFTINLNTFQVIKEISENNEKEKSNNRTKEIIDWLSSSSYDETHTAVRARCQKNTGQWFIQIIKEWLLKPEAQPVFWCRGIPGAGKTVLMSTIIDYIESHMQEHNLDGIAYIYFNYKQQTKQTVDEIFRSIVVQLYSRVNALQKSVHKLYEQNDHGQKTPKIEDLMEVMSTPPASLKILLVFDALDEASTSTRTALVSLLAKLDQASYFILLASRPGVEIKPIVAKTKILDVTAQDSDMEAFASARLEANDDVTEILDESAPSTIPIIIRDVIAHAAGMFLLAVFQIEYICQQTSAKEMLKASQTMPSDAGSIYIQTLEQIDAQSKSQAQLARKVLAWLVLAKDNMTVPEFLEAIAIEPGTSQLDPLNRRSPAIIVRVCRGLVAIDENSLIIRLAHFTVQEFLMAQLSEINSARLEIPNACLTYLSFTEFSEGRCKNNVIFRKRLRNHCFYQYACFYVSDHLLEVSPDASLRKSLLSFVDSEGVREAFIQVLFRKHDIPPPQRFTSLHVAAALGCAQTVEAILQHSSSNVDAVDDYNGTPLLWAVQNGHEAVVKTLLKFKASIHCGFESALNCAARNRYDGLVRLLIQESMKSDTGSHDTECDLFVAVMTGNESKTKALITAGADVDFTDFDGGTALQWAAWYGHQQIATLLIAAGADVNASDHKGRSSLHEAAERGHVKLAKILMDNGADVNARDSFTLTPLHRAALAGGPEIALLLLESGADLNSLTSDGESALHFAISEGLVDCVRLLVEQGIDFRNPPMLELRYASTVSESQYQEMEEIIWKATNQLRFRDDHPP